MYYFYFLAVPPYNVTINPSTINVEVKNNSTSVALSCMALGASSYIWERRMGDISATATGINTNNLILHNVSPEDNGHYRCVAENKNGKNESAYAAVIIKSTQMYVLTD